MPKSPDSPDAPPPAAGHNAGGLAGDRLRSFVSRIERLLEEKKALAEDVKDIYTEVKASGFDTKVVRKVIALRKMDPSDRAEQEALLDVYLHALGELPLFSRDGAAEKEK